jgi:hypothetical protein
LIFIFSLYYSKQPTKSGIFPKTQKSYKYITKNAVMLFLRPKKEASEKLSKKDAWLAS